ncbi:glycosyltransferase [Photobacterium carnosum]|uniref:glycosyltransferase n=1 Tax=Photobacterium carnosum TaxID=2023717 RepID=UPI00128BC485|nr:glycosyltransferase [Photobacterium carnosum]KAE8177962.1 hypothetical protein CIT27_04265 [Photobacterium carnosum]
MKILQLVSSLGIGGAEKFVSDLAIAQRSLGHDVVVVVLDRAIDIGKDTEYEKKLYNKLIMNNIKVEFIGYKARKKPYEIYKKLKAIIDKYRPNIIHSHLIWWSIFVSIIPGDYKHLFTQHINIIKRKIWHRLYLKYFIDKYITICDEAYNDAIQLFSSSKVCKIINGVVNNDFLFKDRSSDKVTQLVTISRLTDQKNHKLIINVISKLKNDYPNLNFKLNIIGDGPLLNELSLHVDFLKLGNNVKFHGTQSNVSDFLLSNDLYLLPSKMEGFSIALIEALSSGIRIIASDVGGNSETLNNGELGILVSKNDFHELYDAICYCLNSNSSNNNEEQVKKKMVELSIETCAYKHIRIYDDLLKNN